MAGSTAAAHAPLKFAEVPETHEAKRFFASVKARAAADPNVRFTADEINTGETHIATLFDRSVKAAHDNHPAPAEPAKPKASWGHITAATLITASVVALAVWAIMHYHDKKMIAKLTAANAQGQGGN